MDKLYFGKKSDMYMWYMYGMKIKIKVGISSQCTLMVTRFSQLSTPVLS